MTIDELKGNVQDFAIWLFNEYDLAELHGMMNRIGAPLKECERWGITDDDFFLAVQAAFNEKADRLKETLG